MRARSYVRAGVYGGGGGGYIFVRLCLSVGDDKTMLYYVIYNQRYCGCQIQTVRAYLRTCIACVIRLCAFVSCG